MAYKVFKPGGRASNRGAEGVTIGKDYLLFRKGTREKYMVGVDYIELFFDEDRNSIGIKPISEKTENSIALRGKRKSYVRAKKFLLFYNCPHSPSKLYVPTWNEKLGMLEVQL